MALQQNEQMTRVRNEYKKPNPIKSEYGITLGSVIHCNSTRLMLSLQITGTCAHRKIIQNRIENVKINFSIDEMQCDVVR